MSKRSGRDIIEIGTRLIEVKAMLPHGAWLPWIEAEFGWTADTARNFMRVAETFGSQIPNNSAFETMIIDATVLYTLSAPDVPAEARDQAITRTKAGEHVTKAAADKMVATASDFATTSTLSNGSMIA